MNSPFPGMDPYLEQYWLDIHASLIVYTRDQIEEQLPGNLIARVEERVIFETEESIEYWIYPDVRIVEREAEAESTVAVLSAPAAAKPLIVPRRAEPRTETYIQIVDPGADNRLVTVIEILSEANKLPGKGQREYRRKQEQLLDRGVNLVEIDLLRRGHRVLAVPLARLKRNARTLYQACVWRAAKPDQFEVYRIPLHSPIPGLHVPLRPKDKDVLLDVQAIVDLAYRKGRYYATINYEEPPDPPLTGSDAKWARGVAAKAKRR